MQTVIAAIFVFMLVILVHEFGHFAVAKLVGIKVNEFSIGMGPQIFQKEKGETKYSLRALPIGGYVSMEGEDEDSDDERGFSNAPILARIAVIVAGAVMNFLLAIVVFSIISYNIGQPTNIIGEVQEGMPAYEAGIQAQDKLVEIDGESIDSWDSLVANMEGKTELDLKIERDGQIIDLEMTTVEEDGRQLIGIVPYSEKSANFGLKNGALMTKDMIKGMFNFFGMLFTGKVGTESLSGPVGIIGEINNAAQLGFLNVLSLVGLISVNLGFFNLIPLPALDGGRLFFLIIELFRGKPIDPEKEGMVHFLGFVLLMGLMIFVTYKDISRL